MFEALESSNPCNCHALASLFPVTWVSLNCILTSLPEPTLRPSRPNWLTAAVVSLAVSVKNAVSNVNSPPPDPVNIEPCLISSVDPDGNVNVLPLLNDILH